jgi:hypothetical protein
MIQFERRSAEEKTDTISQEVDEKSETFEIISRKHSFVRHPRFRFPFGEVIKSIVFNQFPADFLRRKKEKKHSGTENISYVSVYVRANCER